MRKVYILLTLLIFLILIRSQLSFYDLNRHARPIKDVDTPTSLAVIDGSVESGWTCPVDPVNGCVITTHLLSQGNVSYIEIFFSSNFAKTIKVESRTHTDKKWELLDVIHDNNFHQVNILTPNFDNKKVESLRFTFEDVKSEGELGIGEIRAFYKPHMSSLSSLFMHIFMVRREPLSYLFYSSIFIATTLILGFGLKPKPYRKITPLTMSLIWVSGVVVISLLGIIRLLTVSDIFTAVIFVILLTISTIRYLLTPIKLTGDLRPLLVLSLIYLFNVLFFFVFNGRDYVKQVDHYDAVYDNAAFYPTQYGAYQTDFQLPYGATKIWRYNLPLSNPAGVKMMTGYRPSDRTPLLSLFSLPFFSLFGDRHFIFEIISIIISPAFIIGIWVVIKKLFNRKVATVTSILMVFNQWIFFAAHFGQVRLMVIFLLSLFLYYSCRLISKQTDYLIRMTSVTSALAFLAHPFVIIYIVPVAIYQYFRFRRIQNSQAFVLCLKTYLLPLIVFILWQIWQRVEPGNSLLVSAFISGSWENANETMHTIKPVQIDNIQSIMSAKIDNLLGVFLANPREGVIRSYGPLRTTLLPAFGLALLPFIAMSLVKYPSKINKLIILYFWAVIFFTTIAFLSFYGIMGLNWYHLGLIPLFTSIAAAYLVKTPRWTRIGIVSLSTFEFYYITYIYYPFEAGNNVYYYLQNQKLASMIVVFALILQSIIIIRLIPKSTVSR